MHFNVHAHMMEAEAPSTVAYCALRLNAVGGGVGVRKFAHVKSSVNLAR